MNTIVADTALTTELQTWINELSELHEQSILPITHDDPRIPLLRDAFHKRYHAHAEPLDFDEDFRGYAWFQDVVLPAHPLPPMPSPAWAQRVWLYMASEYDPSVTLTAKAEIATKHGTITLTQDFVFDLQGRQMEALTPEAHLDPGLGNEAIYIPFEALERFSNLVGDAIKATQ